MPQLPSNPWNCRCYRCAVVFPHMVIRSSSVVPVDQGAGAAMEAGKSILLVAQEIRGQDEPSERISTASAASPTSCRC